MDTTTALSMYLEFLRHNGNSDNVTQMYFKRVRTFLEYRPEALHADKEDLRQIIDAYIDELPVNTGLQVTSTAVRYFWNAMFGERYFTRRKLADFPTNEAIEDEANAFKEYLRRLGRLSESTILPRVRVVKLFLLCEYGKGQFNREQVTADVVRRHISETQPFLTASSKAGFSSNIRSYAQFLEAQGCTDNARAILHLPLRGPTPHKKLPRCISDEDFAALVREADVSKERGLRDKAMLLLMGNLGLRSCDVAVLTLDDIDWEDGIIHVRDSKSMTDRALPIDSETGSAIEAYVLNDRQNDAETRSLFLPDGNEVPDASMSFGQVRRRIRRLALKAGLKDYCGAHSLRRAAATNMVNNGVPMKAIADVLGHESIATTFGYLRVNIANLSEAKSSWPEGGLL